MKSTGGMYINSQVHLDGQEFDSCTFHDCLVTYSGGPAPVMSNCVLQNCRWVFEGPAGATLQFLKSMYHGGFKSVVDQLFDSIRATTPPPQMGEIDTSEAPRSAASKEFK